MSGIDGANDGANDEAIDEAIEMDLAEACPIIERGGAEIVILEDGRVRIVNPTEEAIELAFELDPENEAVRKRMDVIRETRARRGGGRREATSPGDGAGPPP